MRASGILLPISSLPSKYGIGCFSKEAYEFIDKLKKANQKYWQILPLGVTSYGDSPYQSFSTFAGNPYFIDLEKLVEKNLITKSDCEKYDFGNDERYIDYKKLYDSRYILLQKAFEKSNHKNNLDFKKFKEENFYWLEDFTLFMSIKNFFGDKSWLEWNDQEIKTRNPEAIKKYKEKLKNKIEFHEFLQYEFKIQWDELKKYANKNGVLIIGDIPIYVSEDSSDCWAKNELFQLDENLHPTFVSGVPPDGFSKTGQLWGNPLYNWEEHKKTNYNWWIQRLEYCFKIYDVLRVDHFRGFDEYYSIPAKNTTAEFGKWEKGPGIEFFNKVKEELGYLNIIAEDLGFLTESVKKLLEDSGYPGMKILEFAFDSREESDYLPHNYNKNCVVYTGTHDNQTLMAWFKEIPNEDRNFLIDYMDLSIEDLEKINWKIIRLAFQSVADICIIPVQDYLGLGMEARINIPSTIGGNWRWRLRKNQFTDEIVLKIKHITKLYGR